MRLYRAVAELHQGVDDALAVEYDVDTVQGDVEQPAGLDALQALVEEGGAVHGYLVAHLPVGVTQRLLCGDPLQLFRQRIAEGAAGGGEDDSLDAVGAFAPEALPDGGVLAVNGAELRLVTFGLSGEQPAGDNKDFLVGQGHGLARAEGGERGTETGGAHRGDYHEVRVRV